MPRRNNRTTALDVHSFTLVLSGIKALTGKLEDALYGSGCDDALLGMSNGVPFLDFDREAASLAEAILSAIRDVFRAGVGVEVARIEPDDLVSASEMSRRLGRSRESVRQLMQGLRGPGEFPAPVANLRGRSPLWSWSSVAHWAVERQIDESCDSTRSQAAQFIASMNAALTLRRQSGRKGATNGLLRALTDLHDRPGQVKVKECVEWAQKAIATNHEARDQGRE